MMRSRMESETPMMSSRGIEPEANGTECPAGEEIMRGSCTPCRSGFYKSQSGNGTCSRCPMNTDTNGQTGSTQCGQYLLRHFFAMPIVDLGPQSKALKCYWFQAGVCLPDEGFFAEGGSVLSEITS